MQRFHPDNQLALTHDAEQCFFGDYPTLVEANIAYDPSTAATWVTLQLSDLSEYCGCKEKLTNRSLEQCAELMAERYYWMKVTELMLFFKRFKIGEYGKFYGAVDPLTIMSALKTFINERSIAIDRHEQKKREAERAKWEQEKCCWEEYCRMSGKPATESPIQSLKVKLSVNQTFASKIKV